jgi:hypothetical protein
MTAPNDNKSAAARDLAMQSRAALRVAGRKTGENRWVRAFYSAGRVTASSVSRVMHVLWLEVTGFLFLVLAVIGGGATVREYHRYLAGTTTRGRIAIAAVFTLLFLYFGVNSFWLSRKKARKK